MEQPNNNKGQILRKISDGPFTWQAMNTMKVIRSKYVGKKKAVAIAIYQAFTECASEEGKRRKMEAASFVASLSYLAVKTGKSVSTIKRYVNEFKKLGILEWQCRKRGKFNVSNFWKLLPCPVHNSEGIPIHNNEPARVAHNSELEKEERARRYITKKRENNNFRTYEGFKSIKDLI